MVTWDDWNDNFNANNKTGRIYYTQTFAGRINDKEQNNFERVLKALDGLTFSQDGEIHITFNGTLSGATLTRTIPANYEDEITVDIRDYFEPDELYNLGRFDHVLIDMPSVTPIPKPEEPEPDPEPEMITVSFRGLDSRINILNEQGEVISGNSYDIPKYTDYTFKLVPDSELSIVLPFNIDFGYDSVLDKYHIIPIQDDYTFTVNFRKDFDGNFTDLALDVKPQPEVEQVPFVKLYDVELDSLEQLSRYRYSELNKDPDPSGVGNIIIMNQEDKDLARYIMSLYKYPFNIENTESTQILVGSELTDIVAGSIDNQFYEINYGDIHISKTVWGGVSFKNVTVELFVPLFNKINLDVDEVLNNTLQLKVNVNLLNGKGTLIVKSKKTGMTIYSENQQIGQYIPYIMGDTVKSEMGTDILQNDIINPYVEVKKHIPANTKELQPLSATKLDDRVYYIQSENVMLNVSATNQEKDEISKLLNSGVIVRGGVNLENVDIDTTTPKYDYDDDPLGNHTGGTIGNHTGGTIGNHTGGMIGG